MKEYKGSINYEEFQYQIEVVQLRYLSRVGEIDLVPVVGLAAMLYSEITKGDIGFSAAAARIIDRDPEIINDIGRMPSLITEEILNKARNRWKAFTGVAIGDNFDINSIPSQIIEIFRPEQDG